MKRKLKLKNLKNNINKKKENKTEFNLKKKTCIKGESVGHLKK